MLTHITVLIEIEHIIKMKKLNFLYEIFKTKEYPFLTTKREGEINMNMILRTTDPCKSFSGQKAVNSVPSVDEGIHGRKQQNTKFSTFRLFGLSHRNFVHLTDTGKKRDGPFSLRKKRRLGIAIALLNNLKLLILEEPTNGLDLVGVEELRELIRLFSTSSGRRE